MDPKTLFVIAITTGKMIMPGMPDLGSIPGMKSPGAGAPTKTLTMTLTSDKKVDASSSAVCAVPEGLKIGPKAVLEINLPSKSEGKSETDSLKGNPMAQNDMTMKAYWSSSKPVPEGQPKITSTKDLSAKMQDSLKKNPEMRSKFSRMMNADGSTAYWPGQDAKELKKDSICPGEYVLTTNYCGGTSLTMDKPQDFLTPIDLTTTSFDLSKSIKLEWKPIPNAAAYFITAMGSKEKLMVMWNSSSSPQPSMDFLAGAVSAEKIKKYIESGVLIAPDKTICYIPEGIFQEVGNAMITVTAIGTDKTQTKDGIETQVIVRSNVSLMLKGAMTGIPRDNGDESSIQENTPDTDGDKEIKKTTDDAKTEVKDRKKKDDQGNPIDEVNKTLDQTQDTKNKLKDAGRKLKGIFGR